MTPINTIKNWFTTGSKPTQSQFWSVFDSYRHKSEAIPMKDVSGLSDALANKADASSVTIKANKDASNLDEDNKSAWKKALNIGELPDNIATYDYDVQDQVMMKDGTLLPAGDFGKNIANSHLETTEEGGLTQNYNFAWAYGQKIFYLGKSATTGAPDEDNVFSYYRAHLSSIDIVAGLVSNNYQSHLKISESRAILAVDTTGIDITRNNIQLKNASNLEINALNDKSLDSTYSKLLAINSAGLVAKSDGKLVFKNVIANLNPTEALEIAQLLNGGAGSVGGMSVSIINPDVIEILNENQYVVLQGANLWLSETSRALEIISFDNKVIASIPSSQIISNATNPTLLTFYFNFKDLNPGDYKLRLVSGAKTYVTTNNITLVQSIIYKDLTALTWSAKFENGYENNKTYGTGASAIIENTKENRLNSINPVISLKSSKIFNQGEDFVIEFSCNYDCVYSASANSSKTIAGISNANSTNALLYNAIADGYYFSRGDQGQSGVEIASNAIGSQVSIGLRRINTKIVKKSNLLIISNSLGNFVIQTTSSNIDYSMLMQIPDRINNKEIFSVMITKAYTF